MAAESLFTICCAFPGAVLSTQKSTHLWKTSPIPRKYVPQAGILDARLWKTLWELWITAAFVDVHIQCIIHIKIRIFCVIAAVQL